MQDQVIDPVRPNHRGGRLLDRAVENFINFGKPFPDDLRRGADPGKVFGFLLIKSVTLVEFVAKMQFFKSLKERLQPLAASCHRGDDGNSKTGG